jgi:hypothetical protein
MVSYRVDEVACGGNGQHDRAGIVGPAGDLGLFTVPDTDIRGQAQGRQVSQDAIFIQSHHLRCMADGF